MSICIIDTSIFCEIIGVPFMCSNRSKILEALKEKIKNREQLLLPMTTIIETGNHIGQNGDGNQRRQTALRFVDEVSKAIRGDTPFRPTSMVDGPRLVDLLSGFPDWVGRNDARGKGSGLGDFTLYNEWLQLCDQFPGRRVYIWSLDDQLAMYDSAPP